MICGDWIWGEVHPEYRQGGKRRGKFRATSEVQQRLNERQARLRLVTMIHANFHRGDYALHLTYADEELPESAEGFERDIRNFISRLRRIYKRLGVELRYIVVRGWSGKGRPHLHIILTGGAERDVIEDCWGKGRANCDRLEFNAGGVADLAFYIGGQLAEGKADAEHVRRRGERRWSGSRNLIRPVERTNVSRYSRAGMEEIADAGNPNKIFADRYPGFWLAEFPDIRQNPVTHGWEMSFVLYKPDSPDLESYARRERRRL